VPREAPATRHTRREEKAKRTTTCSLRTQQDEPGVEIAPRTLDHVVEDARTDLELVVAIAAGDRDALEALYARHRRKLWSFIRRYVADEHLAEEALADTLVAIWRHAGSFRGEARVTTWLFGIAGNQAHSHVRRRVPVPVDVTSGLLAPDDAPAPDRVMVARDELERVRDAIEHLSDEHRETLLLAIAGELSYDEIATMLEIPVGTVKSRVARARRMLTSATTTRSERDDEEVAP